MPLAGDAQVDFVVPAAAIASWNHSEEARRHFRSARASIGPAHETGANSWPPKAKLSLDTSLALDSLSRRYCRLGFRSSVGRDRSRVRRAAAAIALILTLTTASPASSADFGGPLDAGKHCDTTPSSQCIANGAIHSVCISSASLQHSNAVVAAIAHYDGVAPLAVDQFFPPCLSYDVHVFDVNVPGNGVIAWTQCASGASYGGSESNGTRWCVPQEFRWNTAYNYTQTTNAHRNYVACHELGHTLGLRHRSSGSTCMRVATISPVWIPPYTTTSQHDRDEIDAHY